jgi:hypothetical protein
LDRPKSEAHEALHAMWLGDIQMHPNSAELPRFWEENWYENIEAKTSRDYRKAESH